LCLIPANNIVKNGTATTKQDGFRGFSL
jgi:hypothetical protein